MVVLFLVFCRTSILFSIVAPPIYSLTSSALEFPFSTFLPTFVFVDLLMVAILTESSVCYVAKTKILINFDLLVPYSRALAPGNNQGCQMKMDLFIDYSLNDLFTLIYPFIQEILLDTSREKEGGHKKFCHHMSKRESYKKPDNFNLHIKKS